MRKNLKWLLMGVVLGSLGAAAGLAVVTAAKAATHKETPSSTRKARPSAAEKKSPKEQKLDNLREESDAAFHKGDYAGAVNKFKAIVALDPTDFDAFGTGAWLMWSLGRGDEATAFMRRGVAGDPKNWKMWEEAGNHFTLRKTLLSETQSYFACAVQLAPKKADTRLLRHRWAFAAENNSDLATAHDVWREVVRDYPADAVAVRKLKQVESKIAESHAAQDV